MRMDDRGIALVKVLFFTSILLAVAAYAARGTRVEVRIANNDALEKQALGVAEAGLDKTWRQVETALPGTSFSQQVSGNGTSSMGSTGSSSYPDYRGPTALGPGAFYVKVTNNSDDASSTGDSDGKILITSIGTVSGSMRQLTALLQQPSLSDLGGLGAKYSLTLSGGGLVDSYNPALGPYGGTNIGTDGNVWSNGNITNGGTPTTITGSEIAGGTITSNGQPYTGPQTAGAPQVALSPVTSPCTGYSSSAGITVNGSSPNSSSYNQNNGQLKGNSSDAIVLSSGTYCFSSVDLVAQATLSVNITNGPVQIYLTQPTSFGGGGIINTTQNPSNLYIFSTYVSTNSNQGITFGGGNAAYMTVYAPETSINFNANGANYYGAAIGGQVSMNAAQFHFAEGTTIPGVYFTRLVDWHEVRGA